MNVYIFVPVFLLRLHAPDCTIHKRQCRHSYTFYWLGNMLSLNAEFFFPFDAYTERERHELLYPKPPHPPPPAKHHLKFFQEQVKWWVVPCLFDPLERPYVLSLISPGKFMSSTVISLSPVLFGFFLE